LKKYSDAKAAFSEAASVNGPINSRHWTKSKRSRPFPPARTGNRHDIPQLLKRYRSKTRE